MVVMGMAPSGACQVARGVQYQIMAMTAEVLRDLKVPQDDSWADTPAASRGNYSIEVSTEMRLSHLLILCAAVPLTSCATISQWTNLQSPQVEVAGIKLSSIGLSSGTFDVTLRVDNPNRVDLHGTALTATIDTKGSRFAEVDLSRAFDLPKGAAVPVVVPVTIQWSGAGAAIRELIGSGAVPYKIGGRVTVDTPIDPKGLDFSGSGSVAVIR